MFQRTTTPTTPPKEHLTSKNSSIRPTLLALKTTLSRVKSKVNLTSPKSPSRPFEPPKTFPFFRLPREIREKIYTLLFKQLIHSHLMSCDTSPYGHPLGFSTFPLPSFPDLCYTSWRIYIESVPNLLRHTDIMLLDVVSVQVVLRYLSQGHNITLAQGITSLTFSSSIPWKPHTTHTTRALLEKCANLRHVKISVPVALCVQWVSSREVRVKSKNQVVLGADYCCLMDCEKLKKVSLVCVGGAVEAKCLGVQVDAVFEPVVTWIRENVCRGPGKMLVVEHVEHEGIGGW
ncbi:hypothetical protein DM02DRAFT_650798 [Periconia macrospinosa]|uniref:Uncharacterized protein n=1 Tax=Periconia macrospinosa TaxID=97972 RepID=A0A2V1E4R1_9PLEO|nr:hypothetical protein DM02DRAFT_650798 [Periconia macrospinosa]